MKLTNRELQVFIKIAQGKSNKRIAKELFVSLSTIRKHRQNIYKKLNISNVAQLTIFAIDHGYICNNDYIHLKQSDSIPTFRETQVMQMVSKGLCNRQIAKHMQVAYSTVRKHRENIYIKFGLGNSAEVTAFFKLKYPTDDELIPS